MKPGRRISTMAAAVVAVALTLPTSAVAAQGDGSAGSGGKETTGSSYSDLNILLRAPDGTPLLKKFVVPAEGEDPTVEYCGQPISYDKVPGIPATVNPVDGRDVYVLPLQGEWIDLPVDPLPVAEIEACDPQPQVAMFVSEVALERLNMARTADSVLEDKVAAVRTKLLAGDVIDLDPAGRIRIDGVAIDAAPEQAGIYQSLMTTGTIPGLPTAQAGPPAYVGPDPDDTGGNSRFDAWELAAAAVGTAASKGVPITVDSIEYYNQVIGFPPDTTSGEYSSPWGVEFLRSFDPDQADGTRLDAGRRYVDFNGSDHFGDSSGFTYNRSETFRGSVTWLDVLDLEWRVSKIIDAVPFSRPEVDDETLTGVQAFAQLADDTRAVILYLHANEVILPGFYMDPVGIDTGAAQLKATTDPAVDLGELPASVFQTQPFDVTASLFNPHEATAPSGGSLIDNARLRLRVHAPTPLAAGDVTAVASDTQPVPFTEEGGDLIGWWGPEAGFPVPPGYHASTTFSVTIGDAAPVGPYTVTLELVDMGAPTVAVATDTATIQVNDNVTTVLWSGAVPSLATQGSYVTLPLQVFAPTPGAATLALAVTGPGDDVATTDVDESLAAGDAKVYADNGATMAAMPLTLSADGTKLEGTWPVTITEPGYTDVLWYLTFAVGRPVGGYGIDVSLVDGNTLDQEVITVVAGEEHSQNPGTGGEKEDTTAPEIAVTLDGTLGTSASFLLSATTAEPDTTTYSCRLTKDDVAGQWEECGTGAGGSQSYTGLTPGSYVFSARAIDAAGNISDVVTRSWVVAETPSGGGGTGGGADVTPPTVRITVVGTAGSSAAFDLSTETAETGVTYACRLTEDGTAGPWTDCTSGTSGAVSFTDLEPGSYVLSVTATDAAGNVSDVASTTWIVPVTAQQGAPSTEIRRGPANNAWVLAQTARFRLGSDTEGARFRVRVNGRAVGTCDPDACVVALDEGRNRIRFVARVGGNPERTPVVRTVFVPHGVAGLRLSAGWRLRDGDAHLFGSYAQTRSRGEVLRLRHLAIKRITLVASTGPRFGKVHVYLGRHRLTGAPIDLAGYRPRATRKISVRNFGTLRQGVVRVVVVSKNRPVRIDGLGIASR